MGHIEMGRVATNCADPVVLYVSGGNTQVRGVEERTWRVGYRRRMRWTRVSSDCQYLPKFLRSAQEQHQQ